MTWESKCIDLSGNTRVSEVIDAVVSRRGEPYAACSSHIAALTVQLILLKQYLKRTGGREQNAAAHVVATCMERIADVMTCVDIDHGDVGAIVSAFLGDIDQYTKPEKGPKE